MNTLGATMTATDMVARADCRTDHTTSEKLPYRGWIWLGAFATGAAIWVVLGFGAWLLFG